MDFETETFLVQPARPVGFNARQDPDHWHDRTGPLDTDGSTQAVSYAIQAGALRTNPASGPDGVGVQADHAYTLEARAEVQAVAFAQNSRDEVRLEGGDGQRSGAISTGGGKPGQGAPMIAHTMQVRRLTPRECERLQGFPDDYTRIPWKLGYWPADKHSADVRDAIAEQCPDGPRYKALGNSWAVPVVRWIGERIHEVA
jgi:DNA (cytosine-5)-methyltransferase 1